MSLHQLKQLLLYPHVRRTNGAVQSLRQGECGLTTMAGVGAVFDDVGCHQSVVEGLVDGAFTNALDAVETDGSLALAALDALDLGAAACNAAAFVGRHGWPFLLCGSLNETATNL